MNATTTAMPMPACCRDHVLDWACWSQYSRDITPDELPQVERCAAYSTVNPSYSDHTRAVIQWAARLRADLDAAERRHGDGHPATERPRRAWRRALAVVAELIAIDWGADEPSLVPAYVAVAEQVGVRPTDVI